MVYGEYEYINVDIDKLVVLPQVRKEKNTKIDDLVDSIRAKGLINPIDIAIMDEEGFKNHVAFINNLWKTKIDPNKYPKINNLYYVIISGHTRYEAICSIAKEDDINHKICAKIHRAKTSEEILSIQLDENIHSEPRLEERAIAIIECYNLGLQTGKWNNQKEFIEQNKNKFSSRILRDALSFSTLPIAIQTYILNGNMFYQAGVELGKMSSLILKYTKYSLGDEYTLEELEKALNIEYALIIGKLQKTKSVKKAFDVLRGYKKSLEDIFRSKEDVEQEMINWFNNGVNRQSDEYLKLTMNEYKKLKQELSRDKLEKLDEFLSLDTKLTGANNKADKQLLKSLSHIYSKYNQN